MYKLEVNLNNKTRILSHFFSDELANIQLFEYLEQFRMEGYVVSPDNFSVTEVIIH